MKVTRHKSYHWEASENDHLQTPKLKLMPAKKKSQGRQGQHTQIRNFS